MTIPRPFVIEKIGEENRRRSEQGQDEGVPLQPDLEEPSSDEDAPIQDQEEPSGAIVQIPGNDDWEEDTRDITEEVAETAGRCLT